MSIPAMLLACLAVVAAPPAPSRADAVELLKRRQWLEAAEMMREVFVASKGDERRAAAAFVVGAYRRAFEAASNKALAADYLCQGLAVAAEFPGLKGASELGALRVQYGPCEVELLPVPHGEVAPAPAAPGASATPGASAAAGASAAPGASATPGAATAAPHHREIRRPQVPTLATATPRRARRPGLAWSGVSVLAAGLASGATVMGVGLGRSAAAAAAATELHHTAQGMGRPLTGPELAQLARRQVDLDHAERLVGIGVGVGVASAVVGAVLVATGFLRPRARRAALRSHFHGVGLDVAF